MKSFVNGTVKMIAYKSYTCKNEAIIVSNNQLKYIRSFGVQGVFKELL